MTEKWLPVVGYEGLYSVSDTGRVRSESKTVTFVGRWNAVVNRSYPNRILNPKHDTHGYPFVSLSKNGKSTGYRVHSLMLKAFVGLRPYGAHARHLDDNKKNNLLANLAWGTPLENSRDKYRNGQGNQHLNKTHCVNGH